MLGRSTYNRADRRKDDSLYYYSATRRLPLDCPEHGAIWVGECCTKYADECDFGACAEPPVMVSAQGRPVCARDGARLASWGQ